MQRWNGCPGLTITDCLNQLDIFPLPKLKKITIGNLPVKPPHRNDLNQRASLKPGAIQSDIRQFHYQGLRNCAEIYDSHRNRSDRYGVWAVGLKQPWAIPTSEWLSMELSRPASSATRHTNGTGKWLPYAKKVAKRNRKACTFLTLHKKLTG